MSEGIRSGVNWMRRASRPSTVPSASTSLVLARPGTPTSMPWPPQSTVISVRSTTCSWPKITAADGGLGRGDVRGGRFRRADDHVLELLDPVSACYRHSSTPAYFTVPMSLSHFRMHRMHNNHCMPGRYYSAIRTRRSRDSQHAIQSERSASILDSRSRIRYFRRCDAAPAVPAQTPRRDLCGIIGLADLTPFGLRATRPRAEFRSDHESTRRANRLRETMAKERQTGGLDAIASMRAGEARPRARRRCICGIRRSAAISTCGSPPTAPGST